VVTPDAFRSQFIFPIPIGFRRLGCRVAQNSDGCSIRYQIVDKQEPAQVIFGGGVTRVELVQTIEQQSGGLDLAVQSMSDYARSIVDRIVTKRIWEPTPQAEAKNIVPVKA